MNYFHELWNRYFGHLNRERIKTDEEESVRIRIERQNDKYLTNLKDHVHGYYKPVRDDDPHVGHDDASNS